MTAHLHGHTTYRVYCRADGPGEFGCEGSPWPRLSKRHAEKTADEHAAATGHQTDVVRLRYQTIREVHP